MEGLNCGKRTGRKWIFLLPGEGSLLALGEALARLKVASDETRGAWVLIEYSLPPRFAGPEIHRHDHTLEGLYVLSGTLTVQLEAEVATAPAGSFILIPPGTSHKFANQEPVPASFLSISSPGVPEEST